MAGIGKDGQDNAVPFWTSFNFPGYPDSGWLFFESGWPGLKRMAGMKTDGQDG